MHPSTTRCGCVVAKYSRMSGAACRRMLSASTGQSHGSPDADGVTSSEEGDHFAGPAHAKESIASIPKGDDLIHPPTAELCQRPLKRLNGFVNIRDNADPHWLFLHRVSVRQLDTLRRRTLVLVPAGTADSSPGRQCWVRAMNECLSPVGTAEAREHHCSVVPAGLENLLRLGTEH